jgi:hypothetical protein
MPSGCIRAIRAMIFCSRAFSTNRPFGPLSLPCSDVDDAVRARMAEKLRGIAVATHRLTPADWYSGRN